MKRCGTESDWWRGATGAVAVTGLLAASGGIVDATSYLLLGGVFTGVLTGNLVLLSTTTSTSAALRPATALVAFPVGLVVASALLDRRPPHRSRTTPALLTVTCLLAGSAVLSAATGPFGRARSGGLAFVSLAVLATAMGVQSAAVRRIDRLSVSTTYLTGAIASAAAALGRRAAGGDRSTGAGAAGDTLVRPGPRVVPATVVGYVAGAAEVGLTRHVVGLASTALAAAAVLAATVAAHRAGPVMEPPPTQDGDEGKHTGWSE